MTDQSRDRVEGTLNELTGRAKGALGEATGDDQQRAEGNADRTKGEALGIARSIVAVMRPYATDPEEAMDNVRRVAHVRWCGRNGIDPDGDD